MPVHRHAVVWIDHREARIFHFNRDDADHQVVRSPHGDQHLHHKANTIGSGRAPEDQAFLHDVAAALVGAATILITGPANEKLELVKHIERHDRTLAARIAGVETLDHPSDGVLLDHARRYFRAADRMRPL